MPDEADLPGNFAVGRCQCLQAVLYRHLGRQLWSRLTGAVRRALVERKYRLALRHPAVESDLPQALSRRLFVCTEDMDSVDCPKSEAWMTAYLKVEKMLVVLRESQSLLEAKIGRHADLTKEERRLFREVELRNDREDGLIFQLGGMKPAKRKLAQLQLELDSLAAETKELGKLVSKLDSHSRDLTHGNQPESINNLEEFVQQGHIRCVNGAHVTLSSRSLKDKRLEAVRGLVGKLHKHHSEGVWYVQFAMIDKVVPLQVGGDGMFKAKFATEDEKNGDLWREQQQRKEMRKQEVQAERAEAENRDRRWKDSAGWLQCSVSYERNPVLCAFNVPLTQFMAPVDLRYGSLPVNHAAAVDEREPVPHSRVRVCSVIANCCGRAPFQFSWKPKWPATALPLGLYMDSRTGEVLGVPQFEGSITCIVRCQDAERSASHVELRFCSSKPAAGAAPIAFPA